MESGIEKKRRYEQRNENANLLEERVPANAQQKSPQE